MQTAQQTTVVCPKLTDQQVQAQIENMHWQQKEQTIANSFQREYQTRQISIEHEHYMVDHLTTPFEILGTVAMIGFVFFRCFKVGTAANVEKNHDDNQSDVVEARKVLEARDKDEENG